MTELLSALVAPLLIGLAPVPADRAPDPLGWGYLGVAPEGTGSMVLSRVDPGTAAAKAGLMVGDELLKIGSLRPKSFDEVIGHVGGFRPGTVLAVEYRRNGVTKTVTVRLGTRPAELGPPVASTHLPIPRDD